jgi:pentapeptide repeat protein
MLRVLCIGWIRQRREGWLKTRRVAAALGLVLIVAVALGIWFGLDWKALIGWRALVDYIDPKAQGATGRKDALQVYAVMVAGGIAAITAAVGLVNLRLTRRNLEQQRELEAQRAQGTALQAYYEQMGKLLTEYELRTTEREEIRELARGQTLTVLQELDGSRKRSLLAFLHGAELIRIRPDRRGGAAVRLTGADLRSADLAHADMHYAQLGETDLRGADL